MELETINIGRTSAALMRANQSYNIAGQAITLPHDTPIFGHRSLIGGEEIIKEALAAALRSDVHRGFMMHGPTFIRMFASPQDFVDWLLAMDVNPDKVKGHRYCMFVHYERTA